MRQRPEETPREDIEARVGATERGPFHVPPVCGFSGPLFPECPPTPLTPQLSSPASHDPHFLPREACCWGLLSKPWEHSLRRK